MNGQYRVQQQSSTVKTTWY